jgi:hypothetical protein
MTVTQSAVTVIAEISRGQESALRRRLEELGEDAANNAVLPFGRFPMVHFARFFVLESSADLDGRPLAPRLVFFADVDGPQDAFLRELAQKAPAGLDDIFGFCVGFSGHDQLGFLRSRAVGAAARYVNTIGRTVQQIKQEAQLHDALEAFLDSRSWRGVAPSEVRKALQEFVNSEPTLAWARKPAPPPGPLYRAREWLRFGIVVLVVIVLLPLIVLGLPIFAILLRRHEQSDRPRDIKPDDDHVEMLAAHEDHSVQNPFTSGGLLKRGWFRRLTATIVLAGTDFLTRHIFNRANLIGVKTIHFGRWVFIDDKRRVLFATSYDGSLENYMDDFIDKIAWGLNIQFSNGLDYPPTNWLVKNGARNEQVFKRFNLTHQIVAPFWYAAYQGLTALNIDNNAEIRAGLFGALDEAATRRWLRRL